MDVTTISETVIAYKKKINQLKEYRKELTFDPTLDMPFLTKLTEDRVLFLQFLRDVNMLKKEFKCPICGRSMSLVSCINRDGQQWICSRTQDKKCNANVCIRDNSWFSRSELPLEDIFLLTAEILRHSPTKYIMLDYRFSSSTIADWTNYVMETLVEFFEDHPVQIGGVNEIVEIDECKIGKKKSENADSFQEQWVFGGIERKSGRLFVVPVEDHSPDRLLGILKKWVLPGTIIHTDSRRGYRDLEKEGFIHQTAVNSISAVSSATGIHTNTIRYTWRYLYSHMPSYKQQAGYYKYLADFMFHKWCGIEGYDIVIKFVEIVAKRNWSNKSKNIDDHLSLYSD